MDATKCTRCCGLIETIKVYEENESNPYNIQDIEYLLVLDFESTCWDSKTGIYFKPEIIEFSVVLYKIRTGEILAEFQKYVKPTEHAKLSEFCINLTGITQDKVDNAVPLALSLCFFSNWLEELRENQELKIRMKNCVFVTWSNWDLGTCLYKECKRKGIRNLGCFKKWIDLRALYKEYYNRTPKGLKGALNEVGLDFIGREHCGLHDARNTAYLAGRMIQDGVLMRITTACIRI